MNPIVEIYQLVFYQPIFNILIFFYHLLKDFGLAVIFLTFLIRLLLLPLSLYSSEKQKDFLKIQEEIKKIEKDYDGEEKVKKIIALYKERKINPFTNFFTLIIQFPILIALYQVFLKGVQSAPFNPLFLGYFNLSKPNFFLALFVGFGQYFYSKKTFPNQKKEKNPTTIFQSQLNLFLSFFTFFIMLKLPSAIGLYLIVNFLFLYFQDKIIPCLTKKN